ncbi:MAG: peptidoglycan DD-metalloendopeptidase family protein [Desulfuromonas sp.]|nr:peptidoglycan DD-metalloendopeptidase family protein [Desulfuromonas sp.]
MNATRNIPTERLRRQRRNRRILLTGIVASLFCWFGYLQSDFFAAPQTLVNAMQPLTIADIAPGIVTATPSPHNSLPDNVRKWTIAPGDNLSKIFDSENISQGILCQIMAADESLLALDILRPGNTLTFTLDEQCQQLQQMELFFHPGHQVVYSRVDDNSFDYEEKLLPGTWENQLIDGAMSGSFYGSALAAGLSEQEAGNISDLFKSKINFARDIRAGDQFQVVRSRQLVDGELTGQNRIEGVRIFARKHSYTAFLFDDGNYYDERGESLARAFQRYPFTGRHRVSSPFNPARRHPITGRISPHKGVDFAMSTGTPIYATGDGEVVRVKNHPYAGKYIEIRHDGRYVTRYLHLSRITVHRGQKVSRGERIALSGNTGRSTGPHLHYELHINGRAVNPLTAKIPMAASIPKKSLPLFSQHVSELLAIMEQQSDKLAGTALDANAKVVGAEDVIGGRS